MICPKCGNSDAKEVVLFTSVEIDCFVCTIREQWTQAQEGCKSWRMPIMADHDMRYRGMDFGISLDGPIIIDPGVKTERIYDDRDHGMHPDHIFLDPITYGVYRKLFGHK